MTRVPDTLPRVVTRIDQNSREVWTRRGEATVNVHALSHRWEERLVLDSNYRPILENNRPKLAPGMEEWLVHCDGEADYTCILSLTEANYIAKYILDFGQLWLDYICINQNATGDKNAQVKIMGYIYDGCTTLIVGSQLSDTMPREETSYLNRAWCIQERHYGMVKFNWDFEDEGRINPEYLKAFASDVISPLPFIDAFKDKIKDDYDYNEHWRVQAVQKGKAVYPNLAHLIDEGVNAMTSNRKVDLAKVCLRIREGIDSKEDNVPTDAFMWQRRMFAVDASNKIDRLYGVWGVPMYRRGIELDYSNPGQAWDEVVRHFPRANFGFIFKTGAKLYSEYTPMPMAEYLGRNPSIKAVVMAALEANFDPEPLGDCDEVKNESAINFNFYANYYRRDGSDNVGLAFEANKDKTMAVVDRKILSNRHHYRDVAKILKVFFVGGRTLHGIQNDWRDPFDCSKSFGCYSMSNPRRWPKHPDAI